MQFVFAGPQRAFVVKHWNVHPSQRNYFLVFTHAYKPQQSSQQMREYSLTVPQRVEDWVDPGTAVPEVSSPCQSCVSQWFSLKMQKLSAVWVQSRDLSCCSQMPPDNCDVPSYFRVPIEITQSKFQVFSVPGHQKIMTHSVRQLQLYTSFPCKNTLHCTFGISQEPSR